MRAQLDLPAGVATSVGPLPHTDPVEACAFVLERQPQLPAVPSLPQRSRLEKRLSQAASGIKGITVSSDQRTTVNFAELDPEAPIGDPFFTGEGHRSLNAFLDAIADRDGPAKFQLTGALTLGLAFQSLGIERDLAFRVAANAVRSRATALLDRINERAPGVTPYIFVDEPGVAHCLEPDFPITPDEAIDLISTALAVLGDRAVTGIRCSAVADWRLVLQAGPQILAASTTSGIEAAAGTIGDFLDAGGWLMWGAIPTDGPLGQTDLLWRKLTSTWCEMVKAGCDPSRLRTQAILCPTRGLGLHTLGQAIEIMNVTDELAGRLHDQALGVKLTAGA